MQASCNSTSFEWTDLDGKVCIRTAEGSSIAIPIVDLAEFVCRTWCIQQAHARIDNMPWMQLILEEPPQPRDMKKKPKR